MLHRTLAKAVEAKRGIDRIACGGACRGLHRVIDLAVVRGLN
jgi:hypothetical protein